MPFGFGGSMFGVRSSGSRGLPMQQPQQQMGGSMGMQPQRQMMGGKPGLSNTMMRSGGIGPSPGMQQQRFIPPSQRPGGGMSTGIQNPANYKLEQTFGRDRSRWPRYGTPAYNQAVGGQPYQGSAGYGQMNSGMQGGMQIPPWLQTVMGRGFNPGNQQGQGMRMGDMSPHFGGGQSLNPGPQTGIGPSQGPVMPPQE